MSEPSFWRFLRITTQIKNAVADANRVYGGAEGEHTQLETDFAALKEEIILGLRWIGIADDNSIYAKISEIIECSFQIGSITFSDEEALKRATVIMRERKRSLEEESVINSHLHAIMAEARLSKTKMLPKWAERKSAELEKIGIKISRQALQTRLRDLEDARSKASNFGRDKGAATDISPRRRRSTKRQTVSSAKP